MKLIETKLQNVYIVEQDASKDKRGSFVKIFQENQFALRGLDCDFKESYYTESRRGVIRGMHFQSTPCEHEKLVSVIQGVIVDVILDLRRDSPTFKKYISIELSRENKRSIYIPKGCAHGFCTPSEFSIVHYMVTSEYSPKYDQGIKYNSFGFEWPIKQPVVSDRDNSFLSLQEFQTVNIF